ncbi:MAG: hypothetical protein GX639_10045 [Fibrobacter sp.]|jgi:hypothetical protein|nr:hypothetical protein [Fibrobacter sp.]
MFVKDLAKILKVDPRVVIAECRKGKWGAVKTWRWIISNPPDFEATMIPKDVARIMGVSPQLVVKWCRQGRVKSIKVGSGRNCVWRVDYEDGTRLMYSRQFGFRKGLLHENNHNNNKA